MRFLFCIIFILLQLHYISGQSNDSPARTLTAEEFYIQTHIHEYNLIIDVRTFLEFRKERLPGAVLAQKSEDLMQMTDTLDLDWPLFVYCYKGVRSKSACKLLTDKGFTTVFDLEDGISGWKASGLPIDNKRIKRDSLSK